MATDKKVIEVSFAEDAKAQGLSSQSDAASADAQAQKQREQEEREFQKQRELWLKQEQQDRKDLDDFFIKGTKDQWAREDEAARRAEAEDIRRKTSLESFDRLMESIIRRQEAEHSAELSRMHSIGYGLDDPDGGINGHDLLGGSDDPDSLRGQIDEMTEQIDQLTSGQGGSGGLRGLISSIGATIGAFLGGGGSGVAGGGGGGLGGALGGGGGGLIGAVKVAGLGLTAFAASLVAYDKIVNSLVQQVGGFSADVVQASTRSRLQEIEDRIRLAREAGEDIAGLENTRSDIASELRGIVREGVDIFAPVLNKLAQVFLEAPLTAIRATLEATNDALEYLSGNSDIELELLVEGNDARKKQLEEARKARRDREEFLPNFQSIEDIFASNFRALEDLMKSRRKGRTAPPFI